MLARSMSGQGVDGVPERPGVLLRRHAGHPTQDRAQKDAPA